jgi:arylformamidase
VTRLPLDAFLGRAVLVRFDDAAPRSYITPRMLQAHGGKIRAGDIVLLDSAYPLPPFTDKTNTDEDRRLLVNGDTARWLLERGVKCVGFGDGVSIENRYEDVCAFHDILMEKNVVFLEVLKNLDQLSCDVFFLSYSPLPIRGLDSSPVRAYAIEGLAEFS